MFSPILLKVVDWTLAISMLLHPILGAVQPEAVRPASAATAPQVAVPEVGAAEPLTATVPVPQLASDTPGGTRVSALEDTRRNANTLSEKKGAVLGIQPFGVPGWLDNTFGGDGIVTTDLGSRITQDAYAVVIQPDGKIVATGTVIEDFDSSFAVARYNTDGTLDNSFGTGGIAKTALQPGSSMVRAIALQPDGKVVVAGTHESSSGSSFMVARFRTDGVLDDSFGTGGIVTTNAEPSTEDPYDEATAVVVQSDGKIVVAGYSYDEYDGRAMVVRYNVDGTLDTTFQSDGIVITDLDQTNDITSIAIQPDGKIVAGGAKDVPQPGGKFILYRYDSSGSLDSSFGTGGVVTTDFNPGDTSSITGVSDIALQDNGKIIAVGIRDDYDESYDVALARYNNDGTLDTSFGTNGTVIADFGSALMAWPGDVVFQPDGNILIAGVLADFANERDVLISRYNADGSLDTTFSDDGIVTTDVNSRQDFASGAALQSDGKLVVVGGSDVDLMLVRYYADTPNRVDFTVNSTQDAVDVNPGNGVCAAETGECTLRAAVMEANELSGEQTVALPGISEPNTYYSLSIQGVGEDASATGDLDITDDLNFVGQDAAVTVIDASNLEDRALHIPSGTPRVTVTLTGLTIQSGGGPYNQPTDHGGGILNAGNLTLANVMISSNSAVYGGGISTEGNLTMINSTVTNNGSNVDSSGDGGGIWAGGANASVMLLNTTIAGNRLSSSESQGSGGITYDSTIPGTLISLENTIIAENEGLNCLVKINGIPAEPSFTSLGHNLSDDNTCNLTTPTDLSTTYPLFTRLDDDSWPLRYGSPAIDAGNDATCPATDQRGVARPQGAGCDIGAYEYQLHIDFTVNSELDIVDFDPGDGECETAAGNRICTLRAALMETNAFEGPQIVSVPSGHYVLTIEPVYSNNTTGSLDIFDDLTLIGEDAKTTIIDAKDIDDGVLNIPAVCSSYRCYGHTVNISGVTVQNGSSSGINSGRNNLLIANSVVRNNTAAYGGGGISLSFDQVTLVNTTISGNSAIADSNSGGRGGGLVVRYITYLRIINSTISGNTASIEGGAIYAHGNDTQDPRITIRNTTITGNSSPAESANFMYEAESVGGLEKIWLENTLLADNTGPNCFVGDYYGNAANSALHSDGHNLSDDETCNLIDPTDIITWNAGLDPLRDNGGPTPTHALLATSPAVDKIDAVSCPATDQRGVERPQGAKCDIGAYEYDGPAIIYGTTYRTGGGNDWPVDNYAKETQAYVGNPINTANGNQTYETVDLRLPTPSGDIYFSRSYSSYNAFYESDEIGKSGFLYQAGSLGPGWMHNYETRIKFPLVNDGSKIGLLTPGANYIIFEQDETNPSRYTAEGVGGQIMRGEGEDAGYFIYTSPEGIEMAFWDDVFSSAREESLVGRLDHLDFQLDGVIKLEYSDNPPYLLDRVFDSTAPETRVMRFTYHQYKEHDQEPYGRLANRLDTITLGGGDGRSVSFGHDGFFQGTSAEEGYWSTNLVSFTDVRGKQWHYVYADENTHADPDPNEEPDLTLNFILYHHLRHFLVERQMPPVAGQSVGSTIIKYWYQMFPEAGYTPAAWAIGEDDGADHPSLRIEYGENGSPTLTHYGTDLTGPTVEQTFDASGRLTRERLVAEGPEGNWPTWLTEYPEDIYRPNWTKDPNNMQTRYTWNADNQSLKTVTDMASSVFYQFVSPTAGLHLSEVIYYPFLQGTSQADIQARLVYNTADMADPLGNYHPDMTGEPERRDNPYGLGVQKPYPDLPDRLLVARIDIDDPSDPMNGFVTRYHYYDTGKKTGLVKCINTPTLGGDTFYSYNYDGDGDGDKDEENDFRLPTEVYQGCDCTESTGPSGGLLTLITYDSQGRVSTTTGPDGMVTRYQYVGDSDLVSIVTQHYRDDKGILEEDTNGDTWNIKTATFYDAAGRLRATIENYHPTYGQGVLVSPDLDKDGDADSYSIDPAMPHMNRVTVYDYDPAGRVVQVTANYDGSNLENPASYYKKWPAWPEGEELYNFATRTVYDDAGRVAAIIENYIPGSESDTSYDLDGDGQAETRLALSVDVPDRNRITMNRYNSLGRLVQVISPAWPNPSGEPTPYLPKTTAGGQTVIYNRVMAYEYDAAGNVSKTIANFKKDGSGDLELEVQLEPGVSIPLPVSSSEPDYNVATCTSYDPLNRPFQTTANCINRTWGDYHAVNGNIYNTVTYTAYDRLSRPIVVVENFKQGTGGLLTITAEYNHITRLYYDSLGRTEWVVREMTGDTQREIDEVIDDALDPPDSNLITRTYYDEATGQPIATVENYREKFDEQSMVDQLLTPGEIETGLALGYNHVTRIFYSPGGESHPPKGLVEAVVTNMTGFFLSADTPPAFIPGQHDRNLTTYYQDHDDVNRPVQVSVNRGGEHLTSLVRYDNLGRVDWSIFDLDGQPRTTHTDYANLGFNVTTEDPAGRITLTTADVQGNPSTTVAPGTLDLTVDNTYDLFGRVTSSHDGITTHAAVETIYDALGQVMKVTAGDRVTTYSYNLLGQVVVAKTEGTSDGACSATAYQYDNTGQLLRVVENYTNAGGCDPNDVESPEDVETEYSYDMAGHLTQVVLANGSTRLYQYDGLGRTTHEVLDPAGQKIFTQYCYDAAGDVTRTVRGSGIAQMSDDKWEDLCAIDPSASAHLVTDYTYNALGQPAGIDYEATGDPLTSARDVTLAYDSFGNRETMAQTGGKTWHYDIGSDGLLDEVCPDWAGDVCVSPGSPVSYTYDLAGNRTRLTAGTQLDTRYVLDDAGRLDCIDIDGNGSCDSADIDYGYNQASQVEAVEMPNGVVSDYGYDPLSQLDTITHTMASNPVSSFIYAFDGLGNRTDAVETLEIPATTILLSPTNGLSTSDTTPTFDWGDVAGAVYYQLQVDDNADFSSPAVSLYRTISTYTVDTPLAPGTYSWRVRVQDTAGMVSAWSTAWTVTITDPPPAPALVAPTNGLSTSDTTPAFDWGDVAGAVYYQLQVDDNADFSSPAVSLYRTISTYTVDTPLAPGTYSWRVRVQDTAGTVSVWSTAWTVTITDPPPAPALVAPTNGSSTSDTTPAFDWGDVAGAVYYQLQVDDNADFSSPAVSLYRTISTYTVDTPLAPGTYAWRVRVQDTAGTVSEWSTAWTVTITDPPPAPALVAPTNGLSTSDTTPAFDWGDVAGAVYYQLQVDDNADFSSPAVSLYRTISTYTVDTPLAPGTYSWRVRVQDTAGTVSVWSTVWTFTVSPPPAAPTETPIATPTTTPAALPALPETPTADETQGVAATVDEASSTEAPTATPTEVSVTEADPNTLQETPTPVPTAVPPETEVATEIEAPSLEIEAAAPLAALAEEGQHAWHYTYDGLSRLTYACSEWADPTCTGDAFTYAYDQAGNLTRLDRWNGDEGQVDTINFTIDPGTNQVDCAAANGGACTPWTYDSLGNLTSDGVTTYTYDTANRLVKVVGPAGTTGYEYNGDGDRVAETHNGERTEFTLDMAAGLTQVLAETTNGQTTSYLYGLGLVAQSSIVNQQSSIEYLLPDALGSVRQSVDTDGRVLLSQTFDPYGNRYDQSSIVNRQSSMGWTGEQSDPSGLTYLRARYYAPGMGRFTQLDPFAGALALPASMNPYGYAHGSPVMYTDPSGEFIVAAIIGGIIIGAITAGTYDVMINQGIGVGGAHQFEFGQINWAEAGFYTGVGSFIGLGTSVCAVNPLACAGNAIKGAAWGTGYGAARIDIAYAMGGERRAWAQEAGLGFILESAMGGALGGIALGGIAGFGPAGKMISGGIGGALSTGSLIGTGYNAYQKGSFDLLDFYDAGWGVFGLAASGKAVYEGYSEIVYDRTVTANVARRFAQLQEEYSVQTRQSLSTQSVSAEEFPSRQPQVFVEAEVLRRVTGRTTRQNNRIIRAIMKEDFPDLDFTFDPVYSPYVRTGMAYPGKGTHIGKNNFYSLEEWRNWSIRDTIRNTIIHEELHHRWWGRKIVDHHPIGSAKEARFYQTILRYSRLRGFKYSANIGDFSERGK